MSSRCVQFGGSFSGEIDYSAEFRFDLGIAPVALPLTHRASRSRRIGAVSVFAKTSLEFIRGLAEESVPEVRLTRSPSGTSGTANFRFENPSVLEAAGEVGDITGLYMVDDEGVMQTVDVNAKFINGSLEAIEANYFMKTLGEWDRFMRFMERYASENGLGFQKTLTGNLSFSETQMSFVSGSTSAEHETAESHDVLQQGIPWQAYVTSKLISEQEFELIKRYDKQPPEVKASMLAEDGAAYLGALMKTLRATSKEDITRYMLALLHEAIEEDPQRAALLHQSKDESGVMVEPYTIFLRHLSRTDWFTQEKACHLLTMIVATRPKKEYSSLTTNKGLPQSHVSSSGEGSNFNTAETAVVQFLDWLASQLRRPTSQDKSISCAVHALASLLRERGSRMLFHRQGGAALLAPLLRQAALGQSVNIQLTYEATLCVWLLSYLPEVQKSIQDCGLARVLVGIVQLNVKEKVTRVALFALKNLLASDKVDVTSEVVDAKLPRLVQIRSLQSWEDEDIVSTLEWLNEKIRTGIQLLSNYDKYKQEVLSGQLEWGPMHTEEQFWKQNIEKFDENEFTVLKVLINLLRVSREVKTLAIGCHDLGQFVTYHPHGRFIVSGLNGKEPVMELMLHSDSEVQKNALLCVQKLMLSRDKLDFLTSAA
eukprot:g6848.t1